MSALGRRDFLRRSAFAAGSIAVAPSLAGLIACGERAESTDSARAPLDRAQRGNGGYGGLSPSADCPELMIPAGFTCRALSRTRAPSLANASFTVPQALDGMAAFPLPNGNIRLIRNHEMRDAAASTLPLGDPDISYDRLGGGGTTSLEVEPGDERDLAAEFVSLSGTQVNCAGGPTPWGSWISCEETTEGTARGRTRDHGYAFEVHALATGPVSPTPLRAMGRFVHEAVAVDPKNGMVYETEDASFDPAEGRPGAGFYRFIPLIPGALAAGGLLQMLAVRGAPNYNTASGQSRGVTLPVEWVDIDDPDPAGAEMDPSAVFKQGLARGGAIFQRLEGCWHGEGSIFCNATSGGDARAGQVWQYRPGDAGGELTLVFESPSRSVLKSPDNLCVSPRGGLVLCEDADGVLYVRGLTLRGQIFDLVRSTSAEAPEFAGSCFSPDGRTLFFNTQGSTQRLGSAPGATYALWGPWEEGAL
ncbi:MAG: alkaline phosphatase PhoX [Gemmatimonadaceae bacterium]